MKLVKDIENYAKSMGADPTRSIAGTMDNLRLIPTHDAFNEYAYEFIDTSTEIEINQWLNQNYSEAVWTTRIDNDRGFPVLAVCATFPSATNKTFYLLKWTY
jgi:hypothetical protein